MAIFDPLIFDPLIFDAGPSVPDVIGFDLYRNGVLVTGLKLNPDQLGSISLSQAAIDAQIGVGSVTVPGNPGWVAGDRLTWMAGTVILYTGYVMDWTRSRHSGEPTEVMTTYQLMDPNRQLIGRRTVDWERAEETAGLRMQSFVEQKLVTPNPGLFDLTYADFSAGALMAARTYTGDGIMDVLADFIKYTGQTVFVTPTTTENVFYIHVRALTPTPFGDLSLTDVGDDVDNVSVFPIRNAQLVMSAIDLKNDGEVSNGLVTVAGDDAVSVAAHGAGGIRFEFVLSYTENEDTLVLIENNILTEQANEKATYSCGATHLTTKQARQLMAGNRVAITSEVLGLTDSGQRIAHVTFTVTRDEAGNPLPGYWDAALELSNPLRSPTASLQLGGSGGDSGRLNDPLTVDHVTVLIDDPMIPVGSSTSVTGQLMTDKEVGVPIPDVTVNWTLIQWEDEAGTVPGSDYSLTPATSLSDISGLALTVVSHNVDGATIKWWVEADT